MIGRGTSAKRAGRGRVGREGLARMVGEVGMLGSARRTWEEKNCVASWICLYHTDS